MDGVFFLKAPIVPVPGAKSIALDPVQYGFACGGVDKYCSIAYSQLWQHFGAGQVVQKLRAKYSIDGRVAFVGFSAAHGFLNPLLNNDVDRAAVSAVLLMDASFGGGKTGYIKAAEDAVAGRMLLVSATSNTGGDTSWSESVMEPSGLVLSPTAPASPMPAPKGGVTKRGDFWYYRYDGAPPHWKFGKLLEPAVRAHLIPYWAGSRGRGGGWVVTLLLSVGAGVTAYYLWRRR